MEESVSATSKKFGNWVLEVDHERLGSKARDFRERHGVKAVEVGNSLGLDRVRICCLETGRKTWDAEILKRYLRAVRSSTKQSSKQPMVGE